jgi:hypothetical protein
MQSPSRSWFFPGPVAAALSTAALACATPPPAEPVPPAEVEEIQQQIISGTPAGSCQWPTAVEAEGCTSTLVHPRVIVTADHCVAGGGPTEISFGETSNASGRIRTVGVAQCFGAAAAGLEGDFGFCILSEEVDMPTVPVLMGCETEILTRGQPAVLVGFGQRAWWDFRVGRKFKVDVSILDTDGPDVSVGGGRRGACYGDSGGPAYVQLADGTWRVFGATSRGSFFCTGATIYTLIHPFVPWLEQTSGIDITPCHDADGTWNPSAACKRFPQNPDEGVGTWDNLCADVTRSGFSATCGDPFDG